MPKSSKESPGGVDPSAGPAGGAAESSGSAAAAASEAAVASAALDALEASDDLDTVQLAHVVVEVTDHDKAKALFAHMERSRAYVSEEHAEVERLARSLIKDHAMHARLTRLAHALAEFRNTLATV